MGERLNFADRIRLVDKVEQLEAENAELREQVASLIDRSFRVADKMNCLNTENEKLRELVSVMPYCMDTRCLECPLCSKFDPSIGGVPECMAGAKLYELGIEVNE